MQSITTRFENLSILKSLFLSLITFITVVTLQAQNENILSLKFGMVNSYIYFSSEGSPLSKNPDQISPTLAIAMKHQLHPAVRLGVEAGFLSEARNIAWSYSFTSPNSTIETEGNFQRNSLYAMIIPEFNFPQIKWAYINIGAGFIHHFQNQYSNATQRIPPNNTIRNLDILVPSGTGFIQKIGAGIQFPFNNSLMIGMDASYFITSLYSARAGYLETIDTPYIGFKGWIVGVNLGFIFNK